MLKVFRELTLTGSGPALDETLNGIERRAIGEWQRDAEAERSLVGGASLTCFVCTASGDRHAASLWLARRKPEMIRVSNVVPKDRPQLTYDEYNRVVEDFYHSLVEPARRETGITATLGPDQVDLQSRLSGGAIQKLEAFSRLANRSTGSSHPYDRERWLDFIITAHREGAALDDGFLTRWLHEEEGWVRDSAVELAGDYARARELLETYDRKVRG